ncbi:hypothetical protein SAMN05421811_109278 [Nonomuraea wenchangensis]|uniref:DivIVA domain-containing protein n=1 Tax=Nonomuraea wenchangensis TaxID=568860 RepID=A0A1I0KSA3_9ACTN|nr:hypothetical protein SAMN05421811_109278 [Nonomuraea wenchangensis]
MPRWYEYDANVLVILAIAAIAILACVVVVSLGRGGELTEFPPDVPPLGLPEPGQLTAVDFMALQLPVNLVGYHTASVDEALRRAATALSERDTRIAVLEQRVSELLSRRLYARQEVYAAPGAGLRTDHEPEAPAVDRELPESGDPVTSSGASVSWDGGAELRHLPEEPEWRLPADATDQAAGEPAEDDEPEKHAAEQDVAEKDAVEQDEPDDDGAEKDQAEQDEQEKDGTEKDGTEKDGEPVRAKDADGDDRA